ncbi:hypothetical protein VULLAG_LOCUS12758 [Vulpes lagopus]
MALVLWLPPILRHLIFWEYRAKIIACAWSSGRNCQQHTPMLWLKTLLDVMLFHVLFSSTASKKKSLFCGRPKTTIIIFDFTSLPPGL